jgi:hypothetical protein
MWVLQIFYKEFLSLRPLIGLAAIAFLIALLGLNGNRVVMSYIGTIGPTYPFLTLTFGYVYFLVAFAVTVVIGFWQTQFEFARGTWLFLLHRPQRIDLLVIVKALCGAILALSICAVPAILYGLYLSIPGVLPAPFQWSYTGQFWRLWMLIPILQLGSYASGLRQGRWYVSKLCPLLAVIPVMVLAYILSINWFLLVFIVSVIVTLQLLELRQEALQRDFS